MGQITSYEYDQAGRLTSMISGTLSPTGLYVTNATAGTVSSYNREDLSKPPTSISVGALPEDVVASPVSPVAYVSNYCGTGANNCLSSQHQSTVSVINTITNQVIDTIVVGDGAVGLSLAISPDGGRLYVMDEASDTVTVVDTSNYSILGIIRHMRPLMGIMHLWR